MCSNKEATPSAIICLCTPCPQPETSVNGAALHSAALPAVSVARVVAW